MHKLITLSSALLATAAVRAQSPNVIFILADDLGYGDISAFNPESKIPTPNIDNLTQDGIILQMPTPLPPCQHRHDIPFSPEDTLGEQN